MRTENGTSRIQLTCVNFTPIYGDTRATLDKILSMIADAARDGSDLIVFPEMALCSWTVCAECTELGRACDWHIREISQTNDGPMVAALERICARLGVHVVCGFMERDNDTTTLYNSAALVSPRGLDHVVRKVHLGPVEVALAPGASVDVWDTEFATVGVSICADMWIHPEIPRLQALKGASLLVSPTASVRRSEFSSRIDDLAASALTRARENSCFVAMANLVGEPGDPNGDYCIGGSVIAGPRHPHMAEVIAQGGADEGFTSAMIDFAETQRLERTLAWRRSWERGSPSATLVAREFVHLAGLKLHDE